MLRSPRLLRAWALPLLALAACSSTEAADQRDPGQAGAPQAGHAGASGTSGHGGAGSPGQASASGASGQSSAGASGGGAAGGQAGGSAGSGQAGSGAAGGQAGSGGISGSSGQSGSGQAGSGQAGGAAGGGAAGGGAGSGASGGQAAGASGSSGQSGGAGGGAGGGGPVARTVLGAKDDFVFELQDLGIGFHTGAALDAAIAAQGLGDVVARAVVPSALTGAPSVQRLDGAMRPTPLLGEWDYSCLNIKSGEVDGSGMPRDGFPCFDELQGCAAPAHGGQAYERAIAYLLARRDHEFQAFPLAQQFIAHTGHHFFQHYGAVFGGAMVVSEVGENINSTQAHVAFTRGAARQVGTRWGMDMSPWFANGVTDYWSGDERVWCERDGSGNCVFWYSGSDHGHSLSLTRRTWYLSYMAGANYLLQEGASVNFFSSPQASATLSPLGQLAQEFHTFVAANPARGTPHVPFAVVLDYYHGLGLGTWNKPPGQELLWNHFPASPEQQSSLSLLDALWPTSFRVTAAAEANYMVNGPLGDTVDVLTDLSDPASLAQQVTYQALFLSGPVHWTPEWKSSIWNSFLAGGGWLVLDVNPTHDAIFADLGAPALAPLVPGLGAEQVGVADIMAGHVVRVASPAHHSAVVAELGKRLLPFAVSGSGFALNREGPSSWLITLLNNTGVDKTPLAPAVITAGPASVVVSPQAGQTITGVQALRSTHEPSWNSGSLQVSIEPGDVAVLRVSTN